jgi:hypothetical protein
LLLVFELLVLRRCVDRQREMRRQQHRELEIVRFEVASALVRD